MVGRCNTAFDKGNHGNPLGDSVPFGRFTWESLAWENGRLLRIIDMWKKPRVACSRDLWPRRAGSLWTTALRRTNSGRVKDPYVLESITVTK
ncbi:hypothetical protein M8C21_001908 [Ambrosia artemisiifolia]|uniref:Uncharacterized protein n=1 Tax=Ambrosia artemisiifolia TaxID=4212 RepID=A0AAD5G5Y4_AMBAR|nr:hypothetical protein M8C21_001908 [Ambrosia artemisiifolia]